MQLRRNSLTPLQRHQSHISVRLHGRRCRFVPRRQRLLLDRLLRRSHRERRDRYIQSFRKTAVFSHLSSLHAGTALALSPLHDKVTVQTVDVGSKLQKWKIDGALTNRATRMSITSTEPSLEWREAKYFGDFDRIYFTQPKVSFQTFKSQVRCPIRSDCDFLNLY